MSNDRELLELAAKAVGIELKWNHSKSLFAEVAGPHRPDLMPPGCFFWGPLNDDGDALRLAVTMRLDICWSTDDADRVSVWCAVISDFIEEPYGPDKFAAARRAIVRAAAEIGRAMS